MDPDREARVGEIECEVAVRDGVHAVLGQPLEVQLTRRRQAVQRQGRAGQSSRAQRQLAGRLMGVDRPAGVAQKGLGVGEQVMAYGDRLRPLQVGVAGHRPVGMAARLGCQHLDHESQAFDDRGGSSPAVEPQVEGDLVVAGAAGMQPGGGVRVQLAEAPLNRCMDVLVGIHEHKLAGLELAADGFEAPLHAAELLLGQEAGSLQRTGVSQAPEHVVLGQFDVDVERAGEPLQLGQEWLLEPPSPELSALAYGASLLTSPSIDFRSRSWRRPCTWAAVRTPMPQSLMKPAAAPWSKVSPLP